MWQALQLSVQRGPVIEAMGDDMPARDIHHDAVKNALLKDGWTITLLKNNLAQVIGFDPQTEVIVQWIP
jgi:hypothetical protein